LDRAIRAWRWDWLRDIFECRHVKDRNAILTLTNRWIVYSRPPDRHLAPANQNQFGVANLVGLTRAGDDTEWNERSLIGAGTNFSRS
jgi:hypothetical protein